ncbi:MAG: HAMP domain-containing histidine kinase [Ktedonobacteraceae bacterium]|nr:HAMP domain-containing histidine kinase [Ktedonobacteraceae bacterium]
MAKHALERVSWYLWHHGATHHHTAPSLPWWRSHILGYPVGLLLVVATMLASLPVRGPHFVWTPFCLMFVIVGFMWGVGPALVTMVLGFLAFNFVVVPRYGLLTPNVWNDVMLLGPFVVAQFIIAFLAARNAVKYRRLLEAKQTIDSYAQELTSINQQLERANHLKDLFVTRAAHELRTPLTTILGEAQLARRRLKKAESAGRESHIERSHVEKIEARAQELRALVEALIDLSSLRSEEVPLQPGSCDFGNLCREITEEQHLFSGRSIAFTCPSDPVTLQADCTRLSQVVTNIVSNAVAYARENTVIHVSISIEPPHVMLQVHNDGPVPSPEQQAHLFEPFYRTPYAEAMSGEGWGLGLTVSKEIVERHGGHIWIEASEGKGVTCFMQVPFK